MSKEDWVNLKDDEEQQGPDSVSKKNLKATSTDPDENDPLEAGLVKEDDLEYKYDIPPIPPIFKIK